MALRCLWNVLRGLALRVCIVGTFLALTLAKSRAETPPLPLDPGVVVAGPTFNATKGVWSFSITSPYLSGSNVLEVLLPTGYSTAKKYQVVYVLPVEPGTGTSFGDGLQVVKSTGYHNAYDVICVQPAFNTFPWFGDHATDTTKRHASYMKHVVLPLIEQNYSTRRAPDGRLLIGFSKSGWGAFSLLMRNPGLYGYAASWDSPMLLDYSQYSTNTVFANQANFDAYSPETLVTQPDPSLISNRRLILLGENLFGSEPGGLFAATPHTTTYHTMLVAAGIPHFYDPKIVSLHTWKTDWARPTFETLIALSRGGTGSETTLLHSDFEGIPDPTVLTAPKLTAASDAGQWILGDPRTSALRAAPGDTALMMQGQSRGYSLRAILATPFVVGRKGTLSFDVAVKNGYGTATSGYGRDRDNFLIGTDELGNELFKIAVMGWDNEGRLAYHSANGSETWLGTATQKILRNNTDVNDPALMRTVQVDLKRGGMDIRLQGVVLASNVPYNSTGKRLCEIAFRGESAYSSVYFNNFLLTTESGLESWQRSNWPGVTDPAVIGTLAEPFGDGISNLEKYATGLDPKQPALSSAGAVVTDGQRLTLKFTRAGNALDVTYAVEASSDLSSFTPIWSSRNPPLGGAGQTVQQEVADVMTLADAPNGRRFMRLRVTSP